jgi:nucleoside-diphosphate-sugar epimerase
MNKHIITVLGGNGYIGKRIIDTLLKSNNELKVFAVCRSGKLPNNNYNFDMNRLTVIKGDCMNPESFTNIIKESTGIIHSIGTLITNDPKQYDDMNRKTCTNVAKIANENSHLTNFVYISAERGLPFPLSIQFPGYLKAKRDCEEDLLKVYNRLNSVILRPGFVMDPIDRNWSVPLYYGVNLASIVEKKFLDKVANGLGEKLQLPAHGIPLKTLAHYGAAGALGKLDGHKIYPNSYLLDPSNYKEI